MEDGIGRKIKAAREGAGLTQEDLAERMEVSRQAVSKWEADLSRPSSENLLRLCKLLGLDWEELAGDQPREKGHEYGAAPAVSDPRRGTAHPSGPLFLQRRSPQKHD